MVIYHFYVLFAILFTLGLLKLSLSTSTFNTLISVFFKCCLFFYVFETSSSFLPVVWYLLKDYIQYSFVFLKTIFSDLIGQPGRDSVLDGTLIGDRDRAKGHGHGHVFPWFAAHKQVLTIQEKESFLPQKSFLPSPSESPSNDMRKQGQGGNSFTGKEGNSTWQEDVTNWVETVFVLILVGQFVAHSLKHFKNYRHTPEERKYATRNVTAIGLLLVLIVVLLKQVRS